MRLARDSPGTSRKTQSRTPTVYTPTAMTDLFGDVHDTVCRPKQTGTQQDPLGHAVRICALRLESRHRDRLSVVRNAVRSECRRSRHTYAVSSEVRLRAPWPSRRSFLLTARRPGLGSGLTPDPGLDAMRPCYRRITRSITTRSAISSAITSVVVSTALLPAPGWVGGSESPGPLRPGASRADGKTSRHGAIVPEPRTCLGAWTLVPGRVSGQAVAGLALDGQRSRRVLKVLSYGTVFASVALRRPVNWGLELAAAGHRPSSPTATSSSLPHRQRAPTSCRDGAVAFVA
jgi:hypothetical protein